MQLSLTDTVPNSSICHLTSAPIHQELQPKYHLVSDKWTENLLPCDLSPSRGRPCAPDLGRSYWYRLWGLQPNHGRGADGAHGHLQEVQGGGEHSTCSELSYGLLWGQCGRDKAANKQPDTWATLMNFVMTSARCWGVVLQSTIHCTHCDRPLKRAIDRSSLGCSFSDAVIA